MGKRKKDGSKAEDQIETDSPRRHKKTKEVIIRETDHLTTRLNVSLYHVDVSLKCS